MSAVGLAHGPHSPPLPPAAPLLPAAPLASVPPASTPLSLATPAPELLLPCRLARAATQSGL